MRQVMVFNMDRPEDRSKFEQAHHGGDLAIAVTQFDEWLRSQIKHADREELEDVRARLYEALEDNNIVLGELLY